MLERQPPARRQRENKMVGYRKFATHAEASEHLAAMQGWPEAHIEEYVGDNEVEYVILVGGEGDLSGLRTDGYIR